MNVENLNLSPEQQQTLAAGGHLEMWDDPKSGKKIPMVIEKLQLSDRQSQKKYKWTSYDYREQLELAKVTRIALLAVLAELHRLHFEAWDKKAPIKLNNSILRSLGFNHHDKIRSLQVLERAGWITVQWHRRESPLVTIVRGLSHGF
jgi:hypothetical protein